MISWESKNKKWKFQLTKLNRGRIVNQQTDHVTYVKKSVESRSIEFFNEKEDDKVPEYVKKIAQKFLSEDLREMLKEMLGPDVAAKVIEELWAFDKSNKKNFTKTG